MPAGWSYRKDQGFQVPVPNGWSFDHDDGGRARWQGEGVLLFLGYAIEAGIAFLIAVLITAPIIHRLFGARVKPPREAAPPA